MLVRLLFKLSNLVVNIAKLMHARWTFADLSPELVKAQMEIRRLQATDAKKVQKV
jgi:hypothetical protein